jgi:hypothetical protein
MMSELPKTPEEFFGCCPNCEAIMCCSGLREECGCMGLPVDFKATDKCGDDCAIKATAANDTQGER